MKEKITNGLIFLGIGLIILILSIITINLMSNFIPYDSNDVVYCESVSYFYDYNKPTNCYCMSGNMDHGLYANVSEGHCSWKYLYNKFSVSLYYSE